LSEISSGLNCRQYDCGLSRPVAGLFSSNVFKNGQVCAIITNYIFLRELFTRSCLMQHRNLSATGESKG
jgi:hypothetical protein